MATKILIAIAGFLVCAKSVESAGTLAYLFMGEGETKQSDWSCIKQKADFAAVEVFTPLATPPEWTCHVEEVANDIKYAQNSGFPKVTAVISTVSKSCGKSPSWIYSDVFDYFQKNGVDVGDIYLDIDYDIGSSDWNSHAENVQYIQALVDEGKKRGHNVGIKTIPASWKGVTGDSTNFASLPLWFDSLYDQFQPFGGWTTPTMQLSPKSKSDGPEETDTILLFTNKRIVCGSSQYFLYDIL